MANGTLGPTAIPAAHATRAAGRAIVKAAARLAAAVAVSPFLLWHRLWRAADRPRPRPGGVEQALSLLPGIAGQYLRRAFLAGRWPSATRPRSSASASCSPRQAPHRPNVYIGPRCHIGLAHVERDVLLAAGVHVTSGARTHGIDEPTRPIREQAGDVRLRADRRRRVGRQRRRGDGGRGEDTVVGAGAVVTRPLPDRVVAAGVPRPRAARRGPRGGSGEPQFEPAPTAPRQGDRMTADRPPRSSRKPPLGPRLLRHERLRPAEVVARRPGPGRRCLRVLLEVRLHEAVRQHQHHRPAQRPRRHPGQRRRRVAEEELGPLEEPRPLGPGRRAGRRT